MKNFPRTFALAGAFLTVAGCATATPALAGETATHDSPSIIGGTEVSNPWAVQLKFQNRGSQGTFACTGEQLNAEWILTAKHCVEDAVAMNVYQSNNQLYPGTPIAVDGIHEAPTGDIALVHLSKPSPPSQLCPA